MPFNNEKVHDSSGWNKRAESSIMKSVQFVKDLGIKIAPDLKLSQQCTETVNKANRMLYFINRNFSFKKKDNMLPMFNSLVRLQSTRYSFDLFIMRRTLLNI